MNKEFADVVKRTLDILIAHDTKLDDNAKTVLRRELSRALDGTTIAASKRCRSHWRQGLISGFDRPNPPSGRCELEAGHDGEHVVHGVKMPRPDVQPDDPDDPDDP